jgi:hypothetical protein
MFPSSVIKRKDKNIQNYNFACYFVFMGSLVSVTLWEDHRLRVNWLICRSRVFDNRVLRRISGTKRGEVAGDWRKLHDEELHNLYFSLNIVRRIRLAGHVAWMVQMRTSYTILERKPVGRGTAWKT